jgi:hypothetical protein
MERRSLAWVGGHDPECYSRIEETSRCQSGKKKTTSGVFESIIKQAPFSERQRIPGFSVQESIGNDEDTSDTGLDTHQ